MRRKIFTLFEILAWAVLFFVPLFCISTLLRPDWHIKKHYIAYFYDINSIIVGSPVNFVGYNVGYVKYIKIEDGRVKLDLAITEKDFSLPKCTTAKIEETGLGGSKSIELAPCKDTSMEPGIYSSRPKKLNEILEDVQLFSKSLEEGMGNLYLGLNTAIGGKDHDDFLALQTKLETTESNLYSMGDEIVATKNKTKENLPKVNKKLEDTTNFVSCVKLNPEEIKAKTISNQEAIEDIGKAVRKHSPQEYHDKIKQLYWETEYLKLIDRKRAYEDLAKLNCTLMQIQCFFSDFQDRFTSDSIQKRNAKMKEIKENTQKLLNEDF